MQDADTALSVEVEHLIKLEIVPEPSSKANDNFIVKEEGLFIEWENKQKWILPGD